MVASGGDIDGFINIANTQVESEWLAASRLMLEARAGDQSAGQVVETISANCIGFPEFADQLRRWVKLDVVSNVSGSTLSDAELSLILRHDSLTRRAFAGPLVEKLARCVVDGRQSAAILRSARDSLALEVLRSNLEKQLQELPRSAEVLARIDQEDQSFARQLISALSVHWAVHEDVQSLQESAVTDLIARFQNEMSSDFLSRLVLERPDVASSVLESPRIPSDVKAEFALAHPESVSSTALCSALQADSAFAALFVDSLDNKGMLALKRAASEAPVRDALRAVSIIIRGIPEDSRGHVLVLVVRRLPMSERDSIFASFSGLISPNDAEWWTSAIDASTATILENVRRGDRLPQIVHLERAANSSQRGQAWAALSQEMSRWFSGFYRDPQALRRAVSAANMLRTSRERRAALELILDRLCDSADVSNFSTSALVAELQFAKGVLADEFVRDFARAVLRAGGTNRRAAALSLICWISDLLDHGSLAASDVKEAPVSELYMRLGARDASWLNEYAGAKSRGKAGKRWLKWNESELEGARRRFSLRR